jgi:hypothetical protein
MIPHHAFPVQLHVLPPCPGAHDTLPGALADTPVPLAGAHALDGGAHADTATPLAGALEALAGALLRIDDHQHAISCEIAYVTHLVQEYVHA